MNLFSEILSTNSALSECFKKTSAIALIVSAVSGCAVTGNSLTEVTDPNQLVTGSVVQKNNPAGIEDTDAELIKSTVASAGSFSPSEPLPWSNPDTGTYGSIVSLEKFMGKHGQKCRGFKTKVSSFAGISFYNGETCSDDDNKWVLSWFKAAN